jgi:hypothetical protein
MKKFVYILIMMAAVGCGKDRNNDCISSMGDESTELRELSDFTKIYVEDRIKIILVQDSIKSGRIELSGPENLLGQITSDIEDGELKLRNRNTCNFVRSFNYELKVKVYFKNIDRLTIESIAEVSCEDTVSIDRLEIYHYALSDINLQLTGEEVYIQSRNSAQTTLEGNVKVLKGSIEEISNLEAFDLRCEEVLLDSHTKLDCVLNASKGLYIKIYNSGNVIYKVEPTDYKILEISTGSGQLLKK